MWQVYGYLLAFQNRFALHISKVVVAKPHRRCGVARALIQVCCHPLEMLQICLTDFSWNVGALDAHLQSPHDIYDVVSLAGSVQLHKEGQCNLACRPSKHSSACALQFHRLRSGRHFRGLLLSWEACTQIGKAAGAVAIIVAPDIEPLDFEAKAGKRLPAGSSTCEAGKSYPCMSLPNFASGIAQDFTELLLERQPPCACMPCLETRIRGLAAVGK